MKAPVEAADLLLISEVPADLYEDEAEEIDLDSGGLPL